MVQKSASRRGRPRSFDENEALAKARDVFWDAGYTATSLDDLSAATGLNRPSLYGAFGDKHSLYSKILADYRSLARSGMATALSAERPLREALALVYELALRLYLPRERSARGCFMIGTAVAEAVADRDVRESLAAGLKEIEAAFEKRFAFAKKNGELEKTANSTGLAKIAAAALYMMAIKSRTGEPRRALEQIAEAALDLICGPPTKKPRTK
jgi:TetR/AcrR family transcriptional regulator, copper-responsive repressor